MPKPGNKLEAKVRQIENCCIDAENALHKLRHELRIMRLDMDQESKAARTGLLTIAEAERQAIVAADLACHGHRADMAKALGIPERTLYRKLREYGII